METNVPRMGTRGIQTSKLKLGHTNIISIINESLNYIFIN